MCVVGGESMVSIQMEFPLPGCTQHCCMNARFFYPAPSLPPSLSLSLSFSLSPSLPLSFSIPFSFTFFVPLLLLPLSIPERLWS